MHFALGPFAVYGLAWASFGCLHSLLSGDRLNTLFGPYARLFFNLIALVHLGLVFTIGSRIFANYSSFGFPEPVVWALLIGKGLGWVLFALALRHYDLSLLIGTKQVRDAQTKEGSVSVEPLHTVGFHRYIRHPLYAAAIVILWCGVDAPMGLATAVWGSLYLIVGAAFEERRLIRLYGESYQTYRQKVPSFIPWRGRVV